MCVRVFVSPLPQGERSRRQTTGRQGAGTWSCSDDSLWTARCALCIVLCRNKSHAMPIDRESFREGTERERADATPFSQHMRCDYAQPRVLVSAPGRRMRV